MAHATAASISCRPRPGGSCSPNPELAAALASWVFTLPGTFLYVYLGYVGTESLGGRSRTLGEWTLFLIGLFATVVAAVYVTRLARRALVARPDLR